MPGLTAPCDFCAYYAELERAETSRTLAEITADALLANCGAGDCWAYPGEPCSCAPGVHLARFARCRRKGLISDPDMCVVLDAAGDVFEPSTVIRADVAVPA